MCSALNGDEKKANTDKQSVVLHGGLHCTRDDIARDDHLLLHFLRQYLRHNLFSECLMAGREPPAQSWMP
jgi:hypothetical protein